jgi:REP element-mobilizing transposase RayT
MSKRRQLDFFVESKSRKLNDYQARSEHGGNLRKGRRKLARPFDPKRALHLTLRAERAQGDWSMLRLEKSRPIRTLAWRLARENKVKIHQFANSGNHLHFLLMAQDHAGFKRFLRTFTAIVARMVTGAKKGNPVGRFWGALAWSAIVNWGRHFFSVRYYIIQNELEAEGLIRYKPRTNRRP